LPTEAKDDILNPQDELVAEPPGATRLKASVFLLIATLGWGISFPLLKASALLQQELVPDASSWFIAALTIATRFCGGALILLVFCLRTMRHVTRSEVVQGLGLAFFAGMGMLIQNDGMIYTSASTSAFLTQFYCLVIPLWLALRRRRVPSPSTMAACALVLAGVALLARVDIRHFTIGRGEAETLVAACFFAGQILWLERPQFTRNDTMRATLVMFVAIGIAMLCLAFACAPRASAVVTANSSAAVMALMATLIVFSTIGSFVLMNAWQRFVSATQASLIYCTEPLYASLAALFLPGWFSLLWGIDYSNETATARLLLGGALISIANVLIQLRPDNTKSDVALN
jgi:drug/metabolite transporter (DMT)-like permease